MSTLSLFEQAEMQKWYTNGDASIYDKAASLPKMIPHLMHTRPSSFKHVWDVNFGPHFVTDCSKVPADVLECAIANISTMSTAKFPATMGKDVKSFGLLCCEIGLGYGILYEVSMHFHQIFLQYLRKYNNSFQGQLRIILPDAKTRSYEDGVGDVIDESYKRRP